MIFWQGLRAAVVRNAPSGARRLPVPGQCFSMAWAGSWIVLSNP